MSMITGVDLKRAKYHLDGNMIEYAEGGWCGWYRCEQFPRLKRCDERKTFTHPVTQKWYVDGILCQTIADAIRHLMAPPVQEKQERVA